MKLEGEKILVTGGAGFIGSHICERLLRDGSEVVVLDDFSTGKLINLEHIKKDIIIYKGRVENYDDIADAIKGCTIIIHEAFPYGKSGMGLDEQYVEGGVFGTYNVLKASVKNNVEKVVNASSVAVYGIQKSLPINEKHQTKPFLLYGATKHVTEQYCSIFSKLYGLNTVSLRYFYVYGPRYAQFDHSAIVNFLHGAIENKPLMIFGNGSQIRDYTYISDVVEGTLLAAIKENTKGEIYNICSGNGVKIIDLAKKIVEIVNKNIEIKFAENKGYKHSDKYCIIPIGITKKVGSNWVDERNYVGDISKAKTDLCYRPKVTMDDGIKKTVEWLRSIKRSNII